MANCAERESMFGEHEMYPNNYTPKVHSFQDKCEKKKEYDGILGKPKIIFIELHEIAKRVKKKVLKIKIFQN